MRIMKSPLGTRSVPIGLFIKVKLHKLEGNKSLVKGYIGKLLIRIDGVGAPIRVSVSYGKW